MQQHQRREAQDWLKLFEEQNQSGHPDFRRDYINSITFR